MKSRLARNGNTLHATGSTWEKLLKRTLQAGSDIFEIAMGVKLSLHLEIEHDKKNEFREQQTWVENLVWKSG